MEMSKQLSARERNRPLLEQHFFFIYSSRLIALSFKLRLSLNAKFLLTFIDLEELDKDLKARNNVVGRWLLKIKLNDLI